MMVQLDHVAHKDHKDHKDLLVPQVQVGLQEQQVLQVQVDWVMQD
jgi:hypothetical protein